MIKAIRDRVVVTPLEIQGISEGGIVMPDSFKRDSNKVKIISVGPGIKGKHMQFKEGDIAFRVKDWGEKYEGVDGKNYFVMTQDSLLATVKE